LVIPFVETLLSLPKIFLSKDIFFYGYVTRSLDFLLIFLYYFSVVSLKIHR